MMSAFPYPWLSSRYGYAQRVVSGFISVLSPQHLGQDMGARYQMDQELWLPIQYLIQLPTLTSLLLTQLPVAYIAELLLHHAGDVLEVDVVRQMVRPKWALRSSVFISNVDLSATREQIFSLFDDVIGHDFHQNSPFAFHNINVFKQSPSSWTVSFKSPSAGPYAALCLKTKFINGQMIFPMACVHINPPRASYMFAGVAVLEIDALASGDAIMPPALVPYFSENPEHLTKMYNSAIPQLVALGYESIAHSSCIIAV